MRVQCAKVKADCWNWRVEKIRLHWVKSFKFADAARGEFAGSARLTDPDSLITKFQQNDAEKDFFNEY